MRPRKPRPQPNAELLRDLYHYDPTIGVFTVKMKRRGGKKLGQRAGCFSDRGYRRLGIDGIQHYEHRLAWLYVYDTWPAQLDHINGNPSDNRIANLRVATMSQNVANKGPYSSNKIGIRGVFLHPNGSYRVQLQKEGKKHSFGYFASLDQAKEAAQQAAIKLHGEFAGHRSRP